MDQLTVTGLDDALATALRTFAKREGISLNEAALNLLRKGADATGPMEDTVAIGSSLDHLMGLWTDQEADEFDAALQDMEAADD